MVDEPQNLSLRPLELKLPKAHIRGVQMFKSFFNRALPTHPSSSGLSTEESREEAKKAFLSSATSALHTRSKAGEVSSLTKDLAELKLQNNFAKMINSSIRRT